MDALQPGDPGSVGGYRLLGRLGAGGMGQVFLGVSPGGRRVAVKLIHPAHAGTAQFRERFAREIEAARRVGGFHTASVVDADPHADPPWMVTAFIEGPALQEDVDRRGPLPPDGVRALGAGLAEGLAAIHACGLVHRDLKPGNVILAADGPRIIDFGIARAIGATTGLTSTGVVVGTLTYMSPEQIRGDPVGPASDVFALGSVLAFAATGRTPFGDDSAATVMFRIFTEPPALAGLADERLRQVIGGCLAKPRRTGRRSRRCWQCSAARRRLRVLPHLPGRCRSFRSFRGRRPRHPRRRG
jgi:serine/threonine protein kinase